MKQTFIQEIENLIDQMMEGIHTACPGVIDSYDPATGSAAVTPKGSIKAPNGKTLPYSAIYNIPVVIPQGGPVTCGFPINPGDGCLIVFSEQSLEAWKAGGESNFDMRHDISNGIAIPGLRRGANAAMQEAQRRNAAVILNGETKLIVSSKGVEVEGDLKVSGMVSASNI